MCPDRCRTAGGHSNPLLNGFRVFRLLVKLLTPVQHAAMPPYPPGISPEEPHLFPTWAGRAGSVAIIAGLAKENHSSFAGSPAFDCLLVRAFAAGGGSQDRFFLAHIFTSGSQRD